MQSDEIMLTFDLLYSEARRLEDGTALIEVDHFPYEIINVIRLSCLDYGEVKLLVRPAENAGRCCIYITQETMMLRNEHRWLYSYRKGVLHKAYRRENNERI